MCSFIFAKFVFSKAGWSKVNANTAQILFLVGDAPPQNYKQEPDVLVTTEKAVRLNMILNTIQCGDSSDTRQIWQTIAQRGEGKYFAHALGTGSVSGEVPEELICNLKASVAKRRFSYKIVTVEKKPDILTKARPVERLKDFLINII